MIDKDFQTKKPIWPMFTWQNIGDTARLFIDNGGIVGSYRSGIENSICIHLDIAKAFNLVVPKSGRANSRDLGYQLTSLVEARYFRDPISHVLKIRGSDVVWSIFDADQVGFKPGGNVTKSKFLRLYSSVNWYLSELNRSFHNPDVFTNHYKRTLYVYSDLVQTQLVGGSETDFLSQVVYDGGNGDNSQRNRFEPQHLQFIPIRKNKFDTVEIGISETDGTQTVFPNSKSETILTLCFKRRSVK